jgi:Cu+-exporting ATPase
MVQLTHMTLEKARQSLDQRIGLKLQSGLFRASDNANNISVWRLVTMAVDPVCGMQVNENQAAGKSEYQGQTYYFCSPGCKTAFDKEPQKYAAKGQAQGGHH